MKATDYRFLVYADRGNGMELSAWFMTLKEADKEARFLRSKGYVVEIRSDLCDVQYN